MNIFSSVLTACWLTAAVLPVAPVPPVPPASPVPPVPPVGAADFPALYNSEPDRSGPLPAAEAAGRFTLPPGFRAQVFAGEPDVQNPIALSWDGRGRLWIAENFTYAEPPKQLDRNLRDRILVFEDHDGDGRFDSRKVFSDELQVLTSIEVGSGGVWAMCPPQLLFIPDRNGDDLPDAAPQVVLDGFTIPRYNHHNFANGLRFGPDGWLYGRCGASAPGEVGLPGCAAADRVPLRGGIWRYHPQRKVFEVLSAGTTNPWGHDWNRFGDLFFVNTVNGHLWHNIPGAHFVYGTAVDSNPHVYSCIDQHADHWHFDTTQKWTNSRDGAANAFGGGHAHVGAMIYQGQNWPAEYRDHLFTFNMHGYRANQEILERAGSGYVGKHGKDVLESSDKWFRGTDLSYGPDGGVFVLDWSDSGECHEQSGVHRTSGRIYKISYGDTKAAPAADLKKLSGLELAALQTHANEWFARQARLEFGARQLAGTPVPGAVEALKQLFATHPEVPVKLRAFWSLQALGALDGQFLLNQLAHENEYIRAWALRLLTDSWPLDTVLSTRHDSAEAGSQAQALMPRLVALAQKDPSALVRLVLASTLQRLPVDLRAVLAGALVAHAEDADDHNLPLLVWYGLIPLAESDPAGLLQVAARCQWSPTRKNIARRLAEDLEKNPGPVNELLTLAQTQGTAELTVDILSGIAEALKGWRKATKPTAWDSFVGSRTAAASALVQSRVRDLSVVFGDGRALEEIKQLALGAGADLESRKAALSTLIENRAPDLRSICETLLKVRSLNAVAARGLAGFDDPAVGQLLVGAYQGFHPADRPQLLAALVSRASFIKALLDAIEAGKIPRNALSAFDVRQIRSFQSPEITQQLTAVWGELREPDANKQQLIAKLKARLTPEILAGADINGGRAVFNSTCAACHTLYGKGGKVGPDLTGSGRDNLDYLLMNIADPSAVVSADFRMTVLTLKDGRVLNGMIRDKTDRTLSLQTMTERVTLELAEVQSLQQLPLSIMPEGMLEALSDTQLRDLIGFLMRRSE